MNTTSLDTSAAVGSSPGSPPTEPGVRRTGAIVAGLTLLLLLAAAWQLDRRYSANLLKAQRDDIAIDLATRADALGNAVNRRTALLEGLAAFIRVNPGEAQLAAEFDAFAAILYKTARGTRAIQAMPGGTCRFVYPLAGNERVVGLNLMQDDRPYVQEDLRRAMTTRGVTLSDPYELRQGGLGLISRMALYQQDTFWGFATIVMDVPHLLAEAGLERHPDNLQVALRSRNGRIFHGPVELAERHPVVRQVSLIDGAWELMAVPEGGWDASIAGRRRSFRLLAALVALFVTTIAYLVANRQADLVRAVASRTGEIRVINEELKRSEQRLRLAAEAAGIGPYYIDMLSGEVFWSPEALSILGYSPDEPSPLDNQGVPRTIHPGDHAMSLAAIIAARDPRGDGQMRVEHRIIRPDGAVRWIAVSGRVFFAGEGVQSRPVWGAGTVIDITERRSAEEALRQSEKRYRDLVELSPEAIFVNRDNRIVYANPAALGLFGARSDEQILGRSPFELFHHDYHALMRQRMGSLALGGPVPLVEEKIVRLDGEARDVEVAAALFEDREGTAIQVILRDVTARRQADEVLRRYEILARNTRDIILFIRQKDWRILDANAAALAAYGYSLEELRELTIQDLRAVDTLRLTAAQIEEANDVGIRFDTVHRRKDGGVFPVEVTSQGMTIGSERVLLSIVRDISERKRAEEALLASERRLQLALEGARMGSFEWDVRINRSVWNAREYELLGLPVGDGAVATESFFKFVHPEDRPQLDAAVADAMKNNTTFYSEFRIVRADGQVRWLVGTGRLFRDAAGEPSHMIGLNYDITDHKRAEAALRESEVRFRSFFEQSMDGVFLANMDGFYTDVNEAGCRMMGYAPGELTGKHIVDLIPPEDAPRFAGVREQMLAGGSHLGEWTHIRKDGSRITSEISARLLPSGYLLAFVRDITQRKQAEEMARAHQRQIAHLSRVASVGEMASSLAHELNQPLTAILGYAMACQAAAEAGSGLPPRTVECLREINNEAGRAAEIVRRVRSYIRKEAPERRPHDINRIVRDAVEIIRHDMQRWGVTPRLKLAAGLPPVWADAVQIQQVLINLMQNALDAMGALRPAERSLILKTAAAGAGVKVSVIDSGPGIALELKERVFEPFFTTKPQGLGLGLSICRSIIEFHGGQMAAVANADRGMSFEFLLPVARPANGSDFPQPLTNPPQI